MKIGILIFLTIGVYIKPTRLLKVGLPNTKYNLEKKFCKGCTSIDWSDNHQIKKAIAMDNNKNNDKEDFKKKTGN